MSFDLDERGADELDALARRDGIPFGTGTEPGFFSGTGTAAVQGLARGVVAKPALLLGDAATPALRSGAQAVDKALGTSLDSWLADQQQRNVRALSDLRSDPITTGFAGQVVGGLFDLGSSAMLYTPEGAAVLEGYGRRQELIGQGVDQGTATGVGAVSGLATYVGVKAPVTLGQQAIGQGAAAVAKNVGYGATVSVAGGVAERGFSRDILKASGYAEQAATMEPYDRTAIAAEAALGALFSGGAAALQARSTVRGQAVTDAALAVTSSEHARRGVAPGMPSDARAAASHASALGSAIEQVLRNDRVNVGESVADATFVRPGSAAAREAQAELQVHVADLLPVAPASLPAPRALGSQRIYDVVADIESRNRDVDAQGRVITSPKGAKGRMQVLDSTNADPGYGVRPAADNSLAERARVGRDYVDALIGHFGGVDKGLAAYNAGPGALDAALARSAKDGGDWLKNLPAETQAYVAKGLKRLAGGRTGEVVTERGMRVPFRYRVAEAGSLVTSNDADLRPNPAYPAELQPRDRTRDASEAQVARIAGNLQPELLAESARASDGAPIVGPDGVVESGNGRMLALDRAYAGERGAEYRAWLEGNADRFGLDGDDVRGMQRPVLVRERTGEVDRAEFARQANESSVAAMSATEQARADAGRISDLSGLVTGEDGTINQVQSARFLRQFVQANVGPNEMGGVLQADGRISQSGLQRVRQAVFSKAYGDADLVAMLTESTDSNVRNVLAGLMRVAPAVARLQDLASAGARAPVELGATLARAAREFAAVRAQGRTVEQALNQSTLFDGLPLEVAALVRGIAENANAPKRLAEMVGRLVDAVDAFGDPRQRGMFDDGAAPAALADAAGRATDGALRAEAADPTIRAAAGVAEVSPDLRVVLEDGTELSAREVLARGEAERQQAANDSQAFDAAINCFLRT